MNLKEILTLFPRHWKSPCALSSRWWCRSTKTPPNAGCRVYWDWSSIRRQTRMIRTTTAAAKMAAVSPAHRTVLREFNWWPNGGRPFSGPLCCPYPPHHHHPHHRYRKASRWEQCPREKKWPVQAISFTLLHALTFTLWTNLFIDSTRPGQFHETYTARVWSYGGGGGVKLIGNQQSSTIGRWSLIKRPAVAKDPLWQKTRPGCVIIHDALDGVDRTFLPSIVCISFSVCVCVDKNSNDTRRQKRSLITISFHGRAIVKKNQPFFSARGSSRNVFV